MPRPHSFLALIILLIFLACTGKKEKSPSGRSALEQNELRGFDFPLDSMSRPVSILAGKPLVVRALPPVKFREKEHNSVKAEPFKFPANLPLVCTPGQDGFSIPSKVSSKGVSFLAVSPEIVVAKNPGSKDNNSHGFSSFGTIQGLKTNQIRCLLQDRSGNLWFSNDDGITRYDGKYLSHFVISNGSYQNSIVLCMLEDKSGTLWFGTFGGGVLSFDGKYFTQYTEKEGLSNNIVNSIIQDTAGNFWMGTSGGGVSKFDGKEFVHYTTRQGLASNQIRSVFQDREGILWFGTFGHSISQFDGVSFRNYGSKEGFPATHLSSIFQDKGGNLWFGSYNQGLIKYDGKNFYQYEVKQGLSNNTVLCMMQEANGKFWIGTSGGGISVFDGNVFSNYNEQDGLSNDYIRCALIGRQGNMWFGTRDGGLVRYNKNLFTHYTEHEGLAGSKVMGILEDRKGDLWFSSYGGGIARYDGKEFSAYSLRETQLNDFVYTLLESNTGDIWLGGDGGGITRFDGKNFTQYTQKEGLCNNSIRCMIEDRKHHIWIGSYGGGVSMFDGKYFVNYAEKQGLSGSKVLCMLEDKSGNMWFGTDGGGVSRFDGKSFTRFSMKEGLNSNTVPSILQDDKGNMWFGTSGGGITRFDGKFMTTFTKNEGLSNNFITSLRQDRAGNLWIGTRLGPNILKAAELPGNSAESRPPVFRNYSYDDGFLGIGCNLNALLEDKNGTIWIGSTNRLSAIRPKEEIPDTVAPISNITNLQLFNENIPWLKIESKKDTSIVLENSLKVADIEFSSISKWYFLPENLRLAYNNNFLTFSFIGISQKQTPKIRYQYRLEGQENHWSSSTELTEITYGNLKPGNYLFRVKAVNSEGIWSNESSYSFSIRSPWWKTWWFYSLLILGGLSLIYSYIKIREIGHKRQRKLLKARIEEQTHELMEKNRELESINNELIDSNSEKDKFFSIIAHDVRGPLSTFQLFTDMLAENLESYDMKEIQAMAMSMQESASNLFKLLENLLEWARMQRGLIQYNPENLNFIGALSNSIETVHQSAKNKAIALIVDVNTDIEVVADKNMLESILRNLISNAIKFTPQGGKITISGRKTEAGLVEISVSDSGIGMDDQLLGNLFKMDVHVSRRGTAGEASSGLGLLLCMDFVEKQNGRIWAESKVGKGSTFYFTLASAPQR